MNLRLLPRPYRYAAPVAWINTARLSLFALPRRGAEWERRNDPRAHRGACRVVPHWQDFIGSYRTSPRRHHSSREGGRGGGAGGRGSSPRGGRGRTEGS